jgi:hypothetical protein
LKIYVPTHEIIRAQLEAAAAKGADLKELIQTKTTQITKKLGKLDKNLENLAQKMAKPGYLDSVPNAVKDKNK